jgi:kynurenine formamidase
MESSIICISHQSVKGQKQKKEEKKWDRKKKGRIIWFKTGKRYKEKRHNYVCLLIDNIRQLDL